MPAVLLGAHAVPALADSDFQQWLSISARTDPSHAIAVQGEVIARFGHDSGGLYELEQLLLLGYKLGNNTTIWAGYVHNPTYAAGEFVALERRAREQITIDNFARFGTATLSGRMRIEQRWRDSTQGVGWRVRPYLRLGIPLGGETATTLNLTAEPFINFNTTSFQRTSGFDRLRSAVSLSMPVGKAAKAEVGYLNQHRFVKGGGDLDEHAITAALVLSL